MDNVSQQKYRPNQWVKFKIGNAQMVSQIKGAVYYQNKGWMYNLPHPQDPSTTLTVSEVDIIETIETDGE
jgi:hypothetical protein